VSAAIARAAAVTAADTSVLVASLSDDHTFHGQALRALEQALDEGELAIPLPALVETYSVLTRMPAPHRLRAGVAEELLTRSFGECRVLTVPSRQIWGHLGKWAAAEIGGGAVYDALILACCAHGAASRLLTFNRRHFERLAPADFEIVVPG
jgi:toxin FitB